MVLLIMLGALLSVAMALANGRKRVPRKRSAPFHAKPLRHVGQSHPDVTIGLRDPARPF